MTRRRKAAPIEGKKTIYIKFTAGVNPKTINSLMAEIESGLKKRVERFVILVSSSGGSVRDGLAAYSFLKGVPAEVVTHNFGSVDSVAVVIYCAGARRLCVPHARFLLHGLGHNVPEGIATAVPLLSSGRTRKYVVLVTFISGLAEPIGALIGRTFLFNASNETIGLTLSFAAGVMTYITADEILPIAHEYGHKHTVSIGLLLGIIFMMILNIP